MLTSESTAHSYWWQLPDVDRTRPPCHRALLCSNTPPLAPESSLVPIHGHLPSVPVSIGRDASSAGTNSPDTLAREHCHPLASSLGSPDAPLCVWKTLSLISFNKRDS
eukprot:gb/GECG01015238.1/.p1 GENE.gb/GECG01015238.1/~~gb/GECG01015238.1/.p1  ORF type:complete len:108 (+),score=2.76 gb/GECG01015238.1/:1-324(+)